MFEKIARIFGDSKKNLVEKTKINIEKRNDEFDFDLLGRSLSLNPYLPRAFDFDFSPFLQDNIIKTKRIKDLSRIYNLPSNLDFIVADTTLLKDISLVSTIRRHLPSLIIHKDIIISKYQILESLVYGADMIVLDSSILDYPSFKILFDFASHLGVRVVLDSSFCASNDILSLIDFVVIDNFKSNSDKIGIYIED